MQLAKTAGATVPIYLEVGSEEVSNVLTYNGTKNLCLTLENVKNQGEVYIYDGDATLDSWVLDIGYILGWLGNVASGYNPPQITCDVFEK